MSTGIIKLKENCYIEWSAVAEAPVSPTMTQGEVLSRFDRDHVMRADMWGTSFFDYTKNELLFSNKAGEGGALLSIEEIIVRYDPKNHPK